MRIVTTILFLSLLVAGRAGAAPATPKAKGPTKPTITQATVDSRNRGIIDVLFDLPVPKVEELPPAESWEIYQTVSAGKDAPPSVEPLKVEKLDTSRFASSYTLRLELATPVSKDASDLDIRIVAKTYILQISTVKLPKSPGKPDHELVEAADGKSDSDIYFSGSYAGTPDTSSAIYDIDAFAGYMKALQSEDKKKLYGKVGLYGQVRTAQSATIDPNSALVYGVYQRVLSTASRPAGPFQLPIFNYRFAGTEFDLTGSQLDFVTSPMVTFPVRLTNAGSHGAANPALIAPHLDLTAGVEVVDVLKSVLAPTGQWHTRGLLAAAISGGYAPVDPPTLFNSLKVSASYQLRLPSSPEIFYDPKFATTDPITGVSTTPPMLGTQPRHFIDAMFCYNFVKWAGASFETTYGSLPPAFNRTDTTYTLGLTFTLKQKSYGRNSILRP